MPPTSLPAPKPVKIPVRPGCTRGAQPDPHHRAATSSNGRPTAARISIRLPSPSGRIRCSGIRRQSRIRRSRNRRRSRRKASEMTRTMKSTLALLVALLMTSIPACTRDSFPAEFDEKPTQRFDPSNNEYYGPPEPALQQLLAGENKNGTTNRFCVVGYVYADQIVEDRKS